MEGLYRANQPLKAELCGERLESSAYKTDPHVVTDTTWDTLTFDMKQQVSRRSKHRDQELSRKSGRDKSHVSSRRVVDGSSN